MKNWLIGKDPDAGKDWSKRRKGWQRKRWLNSITDPMDVNLSKLWETVKEREFWRAAIHGVAKSRTQLSSWTTAMTIRGWGWTVSRGQAIIPTPGDLVGLSGAPVRMTNGGVMWLCMSTWEMGTVLPYAVVIGILWGEGKGVGKEGVKKT